MSRKKIKVKIGENINKSPIAKRVEIDEVFLNYLSELRLILDQGSRDQMFIGSIIRFYKTYGRISDKQFYWVESLREQNGLPIINYFDDTPEIKRPDLHS